MRNYRQQFRELKGREAPAPMVTGWVCCHEDAETAKEMAYDYIGGHYHSVVSHYELGGAHFESTHGYEYYRRLAKYIGDHGSDRVIENFIELQIWGTPDECFERIVEIQKKVGHEGFNAVCSFAGMHRDVAEANMRLFASEVMPRLKELPPVDFEAPDAHAAPVAAENA
jgi:alkanesulfonate monooxygenase SsuD/methylene tetrahydromethanopterin reductase-like flavin-dependent oxidoreductase (luciferase family)